MKKFLKRVMVFTLALAGMLCLMSPAVAEAGTADNTYYNVGCLTATEKEKVTGLLVGTVIVMTPTNNLLYTGEEAEELVTNGTVDIVCIPGVGSSSIGAAAFAKHIARVKNQMVATIVVGYGDYSICVEGTQGYFIGRTSNMAGTVYVEVASKKLVEMYEAGARPSMLVGHSKGNMDLANALYMMYHAGNMSWYSGVTVKTFGCGVNVPDGVGTFEQYIGMADSLGYTNTVSWKNMTYVAGRYHTTNPAYTYTYMPIEDYL